jgi:hypothetical protein
MSWLGFSCKGETSMLRRGKTKREIQNRKAGKQESRNKSGHE